jgi:hypothetical protein
MTVTKPQIKIIQTIISSLKIQDQKEELCAQVSGGRTTHVSELLSLEALQLINHLNTLSKEAYSPSDRMRKKIFSFCYDMKMTKGGKADKAAIYKLVAKKGYLNKPLNAYTEKELPTLVTQIERIRDHYLSKK